MQLAHALVPDRVPRGHATLRELRRSRRAGATSLNTISAYQLGFWDRLLDALMDSRRV